MIYRIYRIAMKCIYICNYINHKNHKNLEIIVQVIYDIVKAHGAELKVETNDIEGEGFIQLPVNKEL